MTTTQQATKQLPGGKFIQVRHYQPLDRPDVERIRVLVFGDTISTVETHWDDDDWMATLINPGDYRLPPPGRF
jgi:hypothetical protein